MSTRNEWDPQTERALAHGTLAELAPRPTPLDEAWLTRTVSTILVDHPPVARRLRWRRTTAAVAAVVQSTGGVAVAAGVGPDFLTRGIADLAQRQGVAPPPMRLIADVTVPGGGRLAAWRGASADQVCEAVAHNWDGREGAGGYGMGCGRPPQADDPDRDEGRIRQDFSPDARGDVYYAVVFGSVDEVSVVSARVRGWLFGGESFVRTVGVDPARRGFGVVLPGERTRASLQREWEAPIGRMTPWDSRLRRVVVDLLDASGEVTRSVEILDVGPTALPPGLRSYDDLGR